MPHTDDVEQYNREARANQTNMNPPVDSKKNKPPQQEKAPAHARDVPNFAWRSIGSWDNISGEDKKHSLSTAKAVENYVMDHLYGDWYYNTVIIIGICFFSWWFARYGFSFWTLFVVLLGAGSVYRAEFRRFNRDIRDDLARIDARNRLENELETMEWLNSFLAKFWVIYMPALSEMVMYQANEILKDQAPGFGIEALSLDEFTLGSKAPRVDSIKSYTRKGEDHIEMDWAFSFAPNDTDDMTKNEIKKKINPKVALGVTVGKAFISKSLPILVEDMSFTGRMNIKLKLTENFPHVKMVSVQFLEPPNIDYALKPVGGDTLGLDIMSFIPGLSSFVNGIIHSTLRPMLYAPNSLDIDVEEIMAQQSNDSVGVLDVTIKRVTDIRPSVKIKHDTIHPFVGLSLSSASCDPETTKVKNSTSNPVFMETKHMLVNTLQGNLLTFDLQAFIPDETSDVSIGRVDVPLDDLLQKDTQTAVTKNIVESGRVVGKIEYDLKWYPVVPPTILEDGTKDESLDLEVGIMKFSLYGASDLDIQKSVMGLLNPYAEVYVNDELIRTTRRLRQINEPLFGLTFESLITQQSTTRIQVLVKDSVEEAIVGRLDTNLQDLAFESSRGQQWITAAPIRPGGPASKFRVGVKWSALNMEEPEEDHFQDCAIGGLRLLVRQAHGLINLEQVGDVDPYIKVSLNGKPKGRTPTIADCSSPFYNQIFFFPIANEHQHVLLDIYDAEAEGKDRPLGSCAISVNDFLKKNSEGYFLGYDGSEEIIEQPVLYSGRNHGTLTYSVSFIPTLPVLTRAQTENLDVYLESKKKAEDEERKREERMEELYNKNPDIYEWVELQDDKLPDPERIKLPLEKAVKYRTGVFCVNILSGRFKQKDPLVQTLFDDHAFPSNVTARAENKVLNKPSHVEGFIRDLPNSKTIFRVCNRFIVEDKKHIYCEKIFDTIDLLSRAYDHPMDLRIDANNVIKIQVEFIPSAVKLAPLDTVLDVGKMKLEILSAQGLSSADSNGKSDPMAVVKLQGIELFRTDKKRRTLDPIWNEAFEFPILSRSREVLLLEVYDWDLTHDDYLLGKAVLDLSAIEPFELTGFTVNLDTQGTVNMRVTFRPEYIRPKVSATSPLGIDMNDVKGAPLKLVGGAAGLAGNAVGNGVGLVSDNLSKGGQLIRGFGKRKSGESAENETQNGKKSASADMSRVSEQGEREGEDELEEDEDEEAGSDLLSEYSKQTGKTKGTKSNKSGKHKNARKSQDTKQGAPSREEELERNKPPSIKGALPAFDPQELPPPQRPGSRNGHKREASGATEISTVNSSVFGTDGIPGRVNLISAEGFQTSSLDIKARVITPAVTKDIYKTRSTKAHLGAHRWNETFTFKCPPNGTLALLVREHRAFGRSQVLSTVELRLEDYLDKDQTVLLPAGNGSVNLSIRYFSLGQ